jgi:hypothetical protein
MNSIYVYDVNYNGWLSARIEARSYNEADRLVQARYPNAATIIYVGYFNVDTDDRT